MKLPPLENLRIFTVVARLRSFTAAADNLSLSHSAVSRRISELEARIGVQLLQRTSRQVNLTAAGKTLYDAAQEALQRIHDATEEICDPVRLRPLLISCERSLAMRWLIPRLASFQETHPGVPIYLSTGGGTLDLERENIDLAIRRADFKLDARAIVLPLFDEYVGPVLAADRRLPTRNAGIKRLHTTGRPEAWDFWRQKVDKADASLIDAALAGPQDRTRDQYFDHFFLSLQAAEAGLGAAIAPLFLVADSLLDQRLLAPCGFIADGSQYVALLRKPLEGSSPQAQFVQWLQVEIADTLRQTEICRQ